MKLGDDWYSYPFNLWPYGDMSADDCLKGGSGENDTGYHPMEIFTTLQPDRGEFDELWYQLYSAISRCNRAIEAINKMETPGSCVHTFITSFSRCGTRYPSLLKV